MPLVDRARSPLRRTDRARMPGADMAATALAERYRDLGFRVIEGGKSNKLAILRTPAVAEMFGKQHKDVLESIREQQEILGGKFRQGFAEHCRASTYRARDGKDQPCFELTKVGFATVATKYDPALRFLLALAFDALETADKTAQASVLGQINKRISELRSRATGQNELDLSPANNAVGEIELVDLARQHESPELHPSQWSPSYDKWRERTIKTTVPRPIGRRHLGCISDMGHTPQGYGDSTEDKPTNFMRDELPLGHSADSWRVWVSEQWFRLPLDLRQRWWRDTEYGNRPPSPEMIQAIILIALP